jgi:alpha-mannosidase
MSFKFSTPGRYLDALKKEKNVKWPIIKDLDFFPYAENHITSWSGYFSSRPGFKK